MDYRRFGDTYVVRMDRGEEVVEQLRELAEKESIRLAGVEALGATDDFTVGVYDVEAKQYHARRFEGAYEIVSLLGTISTMNGAFYQHLHLCAAGLDGQAVGGHLNSARISATCEMLVRLIDGRVDRERDGETGLNLFRFE